MKAALEAWGASSNLFHQGFAKESEDDAVIAAAIAKPGIVLRRPVGSSTAFKEHAELTSAASLDARPRKEKAKAKTAASAKPSKRDGNSEREAAAKYAKEERQRDKQRAKEEAEAAKAREKRNVAIEKAQAALLKPKASMRRTPTPSRRICKRCSSAWRPRKNAGVNRKCVSKQTCERQKTDQCPARLQLPGSKN